MQQLQSVFRFRRRRLSKLVLICCLAGAAVQAQPRTSIGPFRYKYVIGPIRMANGMDTYNDRVKLGGQLREKVGGAVVDVSDRCDVEDCDLIVIDQLQKFQTFEVQFAPKALGRINGAHSPKQTRQVPVDDQSAAWTLASKEIISMITAHDSLHVQQGGQR
jgi:hypothetical protein